MNIIKACTDPQLFGDVFGGESWHAWRTLLAGYYGLETDAGLFYELTNREPPTKPCKELWLVKGRRGGKSNMAAMLAVYEAVFNDHKAKLAPGEVATIMVIAADRKQARTVMRYIRGLIMQTPMLAQLVVREGTESIELANRCVIEIMTASHRGTRGYTVAAAILDEIAFWMTDGANPDSEIISALRPSLATLDGKLIALSSPYARKGVLWTNYKRYFGQESERVLVAQAPSKIMNPTLPQEVIDEAYDVDFLSARAEYGAQFRDDIESYVSIEMLDACSRPSHLELPPSSSIRYEAFVDPSGGRSDSFTLCIVHKDKQTDCIVVDCIRAIKPPFSPEGVVDEFAEVLKSYRIHTVKGDSYAGEWPKEQFLKRKITYQKSDYPKSDLYRDLLPLISSQRVEFPPHMTLHNELLGLERRTARGGRQSIDHMPGAHDDIANAVAGACVHANKPDMDFSSIQIRWPY